MEPRLPRFTRSSNAAPIRLTERDREIIRLMRKHRFLRSTHVVDLVGGSPQQVRRRLQLLYHHRYLERPRAQIIYYESGSRPMVYALGNKGAALFPRQHRLDLGGGVDGGSNRSVTRMFLEHALLVSDVMVSLEISCRQNGRIRLLIDEDLPLPERIRSHRQPFKWNVALRNNTKLGVIPDRAFVMESLDEPTGRNRVLYFLEADCGTMPAIRATLGQSSFHRKLLAYEATWSQEVHWHRFGYDRFRVVTVTTSAGRMKTLVDTCQQLERGRGLFLFADLSSLKQHGDILSLPFRAGHSTAVERLLAN